MTKLKKDLLTELCWLIGILAISTAAQYVLAQFEIANNALDISLHDTYFVVKPTTHYMADFVLLGFWVYLIRAIFSSYRTLSIDVWLMLFNLLLIFLLIPLAFQVFAFIKPYANGWTVYPPLSGSPDAQPPIFNYMLAFKTFIGSEIVLALHLCFVSVRIGMNLKRVN